MTLVAYPQISQDRRRDTDLFAVGFPFLEVIREFLGHIQSLEG
jgi:hypothetical protein